MSLRVLPAGRFARTLAFVAAFAFACAIFGAIPWLSVPTLGQAVWASGFAQSLANADGLAIYATDFGMPHPAPIAFGLSAVFVQALLIDLTGVAAIDAYTLTTVLFLALALWGAAAFARLLGAPWYMALSLGALWLSLPLISGHAGYAMVALGFALLPCYLYAASRLFVAEGRAARITAAIAFVCTCVLAVFMDGYTFVMYFVAAAILLAGQLALDRNHWRRAALFVAPCIAAGFSLAYVLYRAYIGGHDYRPSPMDFFRGWGVDVTMLVAPTRGMHWIWDAFGLGVARSSAMYWGDASVWMTTFIAPLVLAGIAGFIVAKQRRGAWILLAISLAGIYLSLGPSLKVHSTKQVAGISVQESGPLMPAKYAVAPTGSALLSEHLPGFELMRAAYRWLGLGALGLWALTVMLAIRIHGRRSSLGYLVAPLLIVLFVPHLQRNVHAAIANRKGAEAMAKALLPDLAQVAGGNGTLFFAPHGNDFIVNYLAALGGFNAYNIGGDKNVEMAQSGWSQSMKNLNFSNLLTPRFREDARLILLDGEVDAVVLPYFDMLWAAHAWPTPSAKVHTLREQRLPVARAAAVTPCFRLMEFPLFAAVSLTEHGLREREAFLASAGTAAAANVAAACHVDD